MVRPSLLSALFLFSAAVFPGLCFAQPQIRIGAVLHLTGDLAMPSAAFREGIELAHAECSKDPLCPKTELIIEDGKNDPKTSNTASRKLLAFDKAAAVILSSYLDAAASSRDFETAKVPAIVIWDSNPEIDAMGDYIFAIGPWTPSAGEKGAEFAVKRLRAYSAAVFSNADSWSESVANYFEARFKSLGGKVLDRINLNPDQTDFRSVLTRVRKLNPEMIYTPLSVNLLPFYRQVKQLNLAKTVMSSDIIVDEHIRQDPEAFEGIYQTGIADPANPEFERMKTKYEALYRKPLSMPWFVAVGFDGMNLLLKSAANAGADSMRIKDELYAFKDYPGATQRISIDDHGTSPVMETMYRIEKSRFVRQPENQN